MPKTLLCSLLWLNNLHSTGWSSGPKMVDHTATLPFTVTQNKLQEDWQPLLAQANALMFSWMVISYPQ